MPMRKPFIVALLITILFSGSYIYREVEAICGVPLSYRIGQVDERFKISQEEAKLAVADAAALWEEAAGRDLFVYDPRADFAVNFVFDDRQAFADAEVDFRQKLDVSQGFSDAIEESYEILSGRYESLKVEYENKVASYERRLDAYNEKVDSYNESGGAPPEAFRQLEVERSKLDSELETVNQLSQQLNDLAEQINSMSEQSSELIEKYNQTVSDYNNRFTEAREFTQGDYQGDSINIYKFSDEAELKLVLAHELGHALSLGHVPGEESVMFDHLRDQPDPLHLSETDLAEFKRVCSQTARSFWERLFIVFGL